MASQAEGKPGARPLPFRGGGYVATPRRGAALVAFVVLIAVWELAVRSRWVPPLFLPAPSSVVAALIEIAAAGTLWRHVSESLVRIAAGWTVGTLAGLAIEIGRASCRERVCLYV